MRVVKFGGTSLSTGEQFERVSQIMQANPERQVVVTSAPGKRFKQDIKVTDLLIQAAKNCDVLPDIVARYQAIADYFNLDQSVIDWIESQLDQLSREMVSRSQHLANFKAQGERFSAYLLTAVLKSQGTDATFVEPATLGLVVSGESDDAQIDPVTYRNLAAFQRPRGIMVVPGFYATTAAGDIATFSRGGSDITGAILAKGFGAERYENFTDVDGVYAADPRVVNQPQPIATMTYRELRELSYGGFGVFHDEAIIPAIEGQIPINLKNTNAPQLPGTMIVPEAGFEARHAITGIVSADHFSAIYLHRYLLNKETGLTLKLLELLYHYHLSYEHMPSGIDDLTLILDDTQLDAATKTALCADIKRVLQPDVLEWIDDYAIIMVVGEGMAAHTSLIQTILQPLAAEHIHVSMINQGASQISLMLGTDQKDAARAVQAIYRTFFIPVNQRLEA